MHTLSDRQERFIHEYLIDHNASAAAVRAGYSPKTKGTQAAELMKDARVQARIAIEMGELFARLKVSAFELLRKQVCALNFDPAKLFDAAGGPVRLADLDEETKAGLSVSFEERDGERVIKARQTPRHVALAALWRRFDAFQKVQAKALEVLAVQEKEQEREAELDVMIEGQKIWVEAQVQALGQAQGEGKARAEARMRARAEQEAREEAEEHAREEARGARAVGNVNAAVATRVQTDSADGGVWHAEVNDLRAREAAQARQVEDERRAVLLGRMWGGDAGQGEAGREGRGS
jgi:phage terminase small subunit